MIRAVLAILVASAAFGQTAPAPPVFEVASVKPASQPQQGLDFRVYPGGRLHITNLTLNVILQQAYDVKGYQMAGGPAWMDTDRFDVEAKAEGDPTKAQIMAMLQALLADRFQLKVRRESREGNVYALVVAKGGPKLKPPTGDRSYLSLHRNDPPTQTGVHYSLAGKKATLALIAENLGREVGRPVLDRTGIQGEFDFQVDYAIDDNPESGPSIFAAIQEQLGLKLEATKGPVETLVIEHAEKPSGN
ncbi:MAG: TIGR03435 family protein [Bryobacteraceae bacterium]|jgi:uncharacterized protein (TIGR03435 family)